MTAAEKLVRGAAALDVELTEHQCDRMLRYMELMQKWNRTYNLTAVRSEADMLTHHLLDSLSVLPHLASSSVADIGSGGGLPGIPIAIARPDTNVTLVEAVQKKAAFLRQAMIEVGLKNVTVVGTRVEDWRPKVLFDVVISRAFAHLRDFLSVAGHVCVPGGLMAAMKGVIPQEELEAVPTGFHVTRTIALKIPGLAAERHLILVKRDE